MPRTSIDNLVDEFRKNPAEYSQVVTIGQGSEGMTLQEAVKKFKCGKDSVRYWRKVYRRAQSTAQNTEAKKLVTIQVPLKLVQKVRDQAQRIQYLESCLWRKTEEVTNLKTELEGLKNELSDARD